MAKINLADYVIKFFADLGVDKMFVVYGAANGDLIDAFTRTKNTEYVAVLHEQAGGFAAEGYAKVKENKIERQILAAHGNENISFRQILEFILKIKRKKRILVTLPFAVAKFEARIMNILKIYLLTSDQVELLKYDNIADHKYKNISITGIDLADYKKIVPTYLK
ncbi:MAG: thiamine pyrophosphate-binding protein [Rickettsiales bacterium]